MSQSRVTGLIFTRKIEPINHQSKETGKMYRTSRQTMSFEYTVSQISPLNINAQLVSHAAFTRSIQPIWSIFVVIIVQPTVIMGLKNEYTTKTDAIKICIADYF